METEPPPTSPAFFFADDGRLASYDKESLQMSLDLITDLFERVGLQMNASKTKAMIGFSGHIYCDQSSPAYKRRQTGEGPTFSSRKRRKVSCPNCGKDLQERSLSSHLRSQHKIYDRPELRQTSRAVPGPSQTYTTSIPHPHGASVGCPVEGCLGSFGTPDSMRVHFSFMHPTDVIIIQEEGATPLPRCDRCDMHVTKRVHGTQRHYSSDRCCKGARRVALRELRRAQIGAQEAVFSIRGIPLDIVELFKYLGRWLSFEDGDWAAVRNNLTKARQRWAQVSRVLTREGASPRVSAMFYVAICQSVLLFGSETWALTKSMLSTLEGFHRRIARSVTRRFIRPNGRTEDEWLYPSVP